MKLPDFGAFEEFNSLRAAMSAELVEDLSPVVIRPLVLLPDPIPAPKIEEIIPEPVEALPEVEEELPPEPEVIEEPEPEIAEEAMPPEVTEEPVEEVVEPEAEVIEIPEEEPEPVLAAVPEEEETFETVEDISETPVVAEKPIWRRKSFKVADIERLRKKHFRKAKTSKEAPVQAKAKVFRPPQPKRKLELPEIALPKISIPHLAGDTGKTLGGAMIFGALAIYFLTSADPEPPAKQVRSKTLENAMSQPQKQKAQAPEPKPQVETETATPKPAPVELPPPPPIELAEPEIPSLPEPELPSLPEPDMAFEVPEAPALAPPPPPPAFEIPSPPMASDVPPAPMPDMPMDGQSNTNANDGLIGRSDGLLSAAPEMPVPEDVQQLEPVLEGAAQPTVQDLENKVLVLKVQTVLGPEAALLAKDMLKAGIPPDQVAYELKNLYKDALAKSGGGGGGGSSYNRGKNRRYHRVYNR